MRYHFYKGSNSQIICTTTYGGKTVRGVSYCSPNDVYDEDYGKQVAKAKADLKVGKKRVARATTKLREAETMVQKAIQYWKNMREYYESANEELETYEEELDKYR